MPIIDNQVLEICSCKNNALPQLKSLCADIAYLRIKYDFQMH